MTEKQKEEVAGTKNVIANLVNTIVQEGIPFSVTVLNQNIWHRLRLLPRERKFTLYPVTLGALLKISREMSAIDIEAVTDDQTVLEFTTKCVEQGVERMIRAIGYAIVNRQKDPPDSLLKFLADNLTVKELSRILSQVIRQMDVYSFFGCIASMKKISIIGADNEKKGNSISGEVSAVS